MQNPAWLLLAASTLSAPPPPQSPAPAPAKPAIVGTMSDLMVKVIYPASDAIFYITTRLPTTDSEWIELQGKALMVAESANLLMMPGRARDEDRWMQDAKLMLDAGRAAYRAARAKDVAALEALNEQLYESCTSCHQHYRPNYGRRPTAAASSTGQPSEPRDPNPTNPPDSRDPRAQAAPPAPPPTSDRRWRAGGSCAPRRTSAPTAASRAIRGARVQSARSSSKAARAICRSRRATRRRSRRARPRLASR